MSDIDIKIQHSIGEEEALKRVKGLISGLQDKYSGHVKNIQENWEGNEGRFSFSAKGFSVSGKIFVEPETVRISSHLPMLLSFYKSTITEMITEKGKELLKP